MESARDRVELVRGRPRSVQVSGRERRVSERPQQARPLQPAARGPGDRDAQRCDRGLHLALREPEQREPGLRLEPELVRAFERRLGAGQVAATPAYVAGLVQRLAGERRVEAQQLLRGPDRLGLGLRPVAPEARERRRG